MRTGWIFVAAMVLSGCVYADVAVTRTTDVTVVDAQTGKPIPGATIVVAWWHDNSVATKAMTDANGFAHLAAIVHREDRIGTPGQERIDDEIDVSAPGYLPLHGYDTWISAHIPGRCKIVRLSRSERASKALSEMDDCPGAS